MTNAVGPRAVFGVIVPSTNTVVEHDYWSDGVPGIANRAGSVDRQHPVLAMAQALRAALWRRPATEGSDLERRVSHRSYRDLGSASYCGCGPTQNQTSVPS